MRAVLRTDEGKPTERIEKTPTPVSGPAIVWTDPKDIKDGKEEISFQGEGPEGIGINGFVKTKKTKKRKKRRLKPSCMEWTGGLDYKKSLRKRHRHRLKNPRIRVKSFPIVRKLVLIRDGRKPRVGWKMRRRAKKKIAKIRLANRSLRMRYIRHPMECALKEAEVGRDTAYAPIVDPIMDTQRKLLRKRARKEARKKIIFGHIAAEENTGFWPNSWNLPTFLGRSVADSVKSSRSDL